MVTLVYLNVNIYKKIMETRRTREQNMNNRGPQSQVNNNRIAGNNSEDGGATEAGGAGRAGRKEEVSKKDIKMAIILLTIVLVFFCCHLPR